jgi:hypothetical protein
MGFPPAGRIDRACRSGRVAPAEPPTAVIVDAEQLVERHVALVVERFETVWCRCHWGGRRRCDARRRCDGRGRCRGRGQCGSRGIAVEVGIAVSVVTVEVVVTAAAAPARAAATINSDAATTDTLRAQRARRLALRGSPASALAGVGDSLRSPFREIARSSHVATVRPVAGLQTTTCPAPEQTQRRAGVFHAPQEKGRKCVSSRWGPACLEGRFAACADPFCLHECAFLVYTKCTFLASRRVRCRCVSRVGA